MSYIEPTWSEGITARDMNILESQYAAGIEALQVYDHDSVYYPKAEADSKFWHTDNKSGSDADTISSWHASDLLGAVLPIGTIIAYEQSTPPYPGWYLCNGQIANGRETPDLRDYFPAGAGGSHPVGTDGGQDSVTLSGTVTIAEHALTISEMPNHSHGYTDYYNSGGGYYNGNDVSVPSATRTTDLETTGNAGSGQPHGHPGSSVAFIGPMDNRMPYYGLYFYMRA